MNLLKELKKYCFLYLTFVKNCLISQMEYRANFIMGLVVESGFLFAKIIYVVVVYQTGVTINGMSPDSILLFIGTYTLLTGIMCSLFFFNFTKISEYVRDGTLDVFITKPVSTQFMATLRYIDFGTPVPNVIGGIIMIVTAWKRVGIPADFKNIAGYTLLTASGVILTYALLLFPSLLSFWTVKTQAVYDVTYAVWDFNNMPMGIYGKWIKRIGVIVIPVFVITNFPCMFVLKQLNAVSLIWGLVVPIILLLLVRKFWNFALRSYTSASS